MNAFEPDRSKEQLILRRGSVRRGRGKYSSATQPVQRPVEAHPAVRYACFMFMLHAPEDVGPASRGRAPEKRRFGCVSGEPSPLEGGSLELQPRIWMHFGPIFPMSSSFRGGNRSGGAGENI